VTSRGVSVGGKDGLGPVPPDVLVEERRGLVQVAEARSDCLGLEQSLPHQLQDLRDYSSSVGATELIGRVASIHRSGRDPHASMKRADAGADAVRGGRREG
jgi:hypothetical protein